MRSTTLIAAVSLGLALAACGKKQDQDTSTTNDTSMTTDANMSTDSNMSAGMNDSSATMNNSSMRMNGSSTAAAMPAQGFVDTIAGSDMFEIQSGKLAQTMGSSATVKDMGKMLVADHTKSSDMLKAAAKKSSPMVALPMTLPAAQQAKITALKAAKGTEFDRLFLQQQAEGHRMALDTLKSYASGGDQPSLKSFASTAAPVVQTHLDKLQAMPK